MSRWWSYNRMDPSPRFFACMALLDIRAWQLIWGHDQPVYGLVQGLEGNRFYTRVEDLAAHY